MKNTQLSSFVKTSLLLTIFSPFSIAQAELVNNGSLTGAIGNNTLPIGWFAGSTTAEKPNSPDTINQNNNVGVTNLLSFASAPSESPDGGTWIGIGADGKRVNESFSQNITFTKGEYYEISWFDANFGYARRGYTGENQFIAYLNNGTTNEFTFTGSILPLNEGWTLQTFKPFIPTQTNYTLTFKLANSTKSYLSIDGISIDFSDIDPVAPVPEPESYAMMLAGLSMLGFTIRRRKS